MPHFPSEITAGAERSRLLLFVGPGLRPDAELSALLARSGWRCLWLAGAEAALLSAAHARFDALVMQAEAGGGPPARQIEALRQALACPVLVVAAVADEVDEIIALELGADAFLAGALAPRRLRAHLEALLRQRPAPDGAAGASVRLGAWTLDPATQRLADGERVVVLSGLQTVLLQCLAAEAGRVVSRAGLAAALGPGRALHVRSVDVYIARLRRRLREQRVDGLGIEGVRGRGYALSVAPAATNPGPSLHWVSRASALGALQAAA